MPPSSPVAADAAAPDSRAERNRTAAVVPVCGHDLPLEPRAFDTMLGVPSNRGAWQETFGSLVRDTGSSDLEHPAGYMFKDLPEVDGAGALRRLHDREMDRWGVEAGLLPVTFADDDLGRDAVAEAPDRLVRQLRRRPQPRDGRRAGPEARGGPSSACGPPAASRAGTNPQVAINDTADVPALRRMRGARHPDLPQHGGARAPLPDGAPARRAPRRGLLRLPRAGDRDAATACEPWTELMVKLMLKWPGLHYSTSALRPEALPEGDHRLRQHPGRREGHLRRLLPHGPVARADLHRDAERAVQGRGVAASSSATTPGGCSSSTPEPRADQGRPSVSRGRDLRRRGGTNGPVWCHPAIQNQVSVSTATDP